MTELATQHADHDFDAEMADTVLLQHDMERMRLEDSLYEFVKAAWSVVEPSQPFTANWHVVETCRVLEEVAQGKHRRVIFNFPSGTLKSLIISVFFPAWRWAKNPKLRVLTASYAAHLTTRDNLRVRDIIVSPWFQSYWKVQLVEDQNTKTRYNTDAGGWRIATSVNGVGTGEHPDLIIIDDPTTVEQAKSEPERTRANEWFDGTISSRGITRPKLCIIVVMQRLHVDDLSGHLIKRGGWKVVTWPMRYEVARPASEDDPGFTPDPSDPRRVAGELFFPALVPEDKVRQLELDLGPWDAQAQLQQQPSLKGGGLFQRGWFKFLDARPTNIVRSARGWDTAGTEDGGDWTVGVRIDETLDKRFIISDVQRGQLSPAGVDQLMYATAELDGKGVAVREEKEGGASGKAVVEARGKMLAGWDYKFVQVSGSKITRAKPFRAQVEAGNVYLVRGPWNEAYLNVVCGFPALKHDDDVDGSSCAFNAVLLEPKPKRKPSLTW